MKNAELEATAMRLFWLLVTEPDVEVRKDTLDQMRSMVADSGNDAVREFFVSFCDLVEEEAERRHTS